MMASDVCPNCGSANVRWRRRRPYDFVFTYVRWLIDLVAGRSLGATRATDLSAPYSERGSEVRVKATRYAVERTAYEERVGTMTAARFWRCPDCRQEGQVFEKLEGVIEERERLAGMQNEIAGKLAVINDPIKDGEQKPD
jgi:predicted RNA-binding Zn-ribbon protein involved in translation (DUF1610 family)